VNLLLFEPGERVDEHRVRIGGERLRHLREVFRAAPGHRLAVGEIGGLLGSGVVAALTADHALLEIELHQPPPPRLPLAVVLALPRPKMLRRLLRAVAEFGVAELCLLHTARVEKSFWQSDLLAPAAIRGFLLQGAAQARDTRLPEVSLARRFRPFAEDRLPGLARGRRALVAHPGNYPPCPVGADSPTLLLVGPEAGFTDFEIDLAAAAGCRPVSLGARTLRVETALVAALGRLGTPP
jgi:RsmE family RNA methyltransferase